jgi:hypothetical protein
MAAVLPAQTSHNRKCKVLRVWHGTSEKYLPGILEDGFAAIASLDSGYRSWLRSFGCVVLRVRNAASCFAFD